MKDFLRKQWRWIVMAIIFCLVLLAYSYQDSFSQTLPPPLLSPTDAPPILLSTSTIAVEINSPIRLKIPSIGVEAAVEYVGLTSSGEMDVPKDTKNVAWFNLGPMPGAEGSSVMAGHFDDADGQAAVFHDLKKIKQGDQLLVVDSQGKTITFVVKKISLYDSAALATEVFSSSEGQHLNLITCSGTWSKLKKSYTERLVIFSDQVTQ